MLRFFLMAVALFGLFVAPGLCAEEKAAAPEQTVEKPRKPDVIYVPTPPKVVKEMLRLAEVKKSDLVYDLGCGDGRIVVMAAKQYGCHAMGFDIDPKRIQASLENVKKNKV